MCLPTPRTIIDGSRAAGVPANVLCGVSGAKNEWFVAYESREGEGWRFLLADVLR